MEGRCNAMSISFRERLATGLPPRVIAYIYYLLHFVGTTYENFALNLYIFKSYNPTKSTT